MPFLAWCVKASCLDLSGKWQSSLSQQRVTRFGAVEVVAFWYLWDVSNYLRG